MSYLYDDEYGDEPEREHCSICGSPDVCAGNGQKSYCSRCWSDPRRVGGALADQFAELGDDE